MNAWKPHPYRADAIERVVNIPGANVQISIEARACTFGIEVVSWLRNRSGFNSSIVSMAWWPSTRLLNFAAKSALKKAIRRYERRTSLRIETGVQS